MLTHKVPQEMYPLGIAYQSKSSICIADIEVLTLHPNGRMCSAGRKFLQMSLASISSSNPVSCLLQNKWHKISLQVHCKPTSSRSICLQPAQMNFCVSHALFRCPILLLGFTVPQNMDLNWFIPIITKGRKINPSKAHSLCFTYMISNPVQQFEIKSSVR
jgi:hypothetical protein